MKPRELRQLSLSQHGMTLIEILLTLAIASMLMVGLMQLINPIMSAQKTNVAKGNALQDLRFAMQQVERFVEHSSVLIIPKPDNAATTPVESVRDVLALAMPADYDRDQDGWADANNDKDYQDENGNGSRDAGEPERIDEDFSDDRFNDGASGIIGIDDDFDGSVDENGKKDEDEDGTANEDSVDGIDNDNDGLIDEDTKKQMTDDGKSGLAGVDDDNDGSIDEDDKNDDDEDGSQDEDWRDVIVFSLSDGSLIQRIPNIDPVDGTDYTEHTIAENVTNFQVKRFLGGDGKTVLLTIFISVSDEDGTEHASTITTRVGTAL